MDELRDARFSTENPRNIGLIEAVNEAVRAVLSPTGWTNLDWDVEERRLVVMHSAHGRLPLSALSDGVRNTTAIVADIARRCAALNPHLRERAARDTPGVLLIDEVDMHLHPRWQQLIIELLHEAFPRLQIIATTHSPHVLSTVDKASIRVVRVVDAQVSIDTPRFQTKGVQSADALASIMGVDPVPQIAEAVQLTRYRALIEDGMADTPEAQTLRASLVAHFGNDHPVMLDCDRLIRFQAFRLRRERKEGTE
jgi:predicted ATP-binding protein involved in virulence